MQANNAIPYLQTPVPQQTEYRGTSDKSGKDDTFSKALGKELSQGKETEKQPAADKPAAEKPADGKDPGTDAAGSQAAAVVIPLVIQNVPVEQLATGEMPIQTPQVPVEEAENVLIPKAEFPVTLKAAEVPVQTGDVKTEAPLPQTAEMSKAAPAAAGEALKETAPSGPQDKTAVSQVNAEPAVKSEKAPEAAVIKPVTQGEEKQQVQTEVKDTNLADMSKNIRQDMVSRQASFEVPAPSPRQTVDLSDVKAGIQKLSQSMADQMAKGRTEFEIWLEPANLGKMAIKVAYESGRAMVSIMCTNEKTMELISQNARNLGNILQQHTGENTVVVVEHPQSDYLQQQAEQENKGGYQEQEQQSEKQNDENDEAQSFLQQLRLGLAQ